MAENTFDAGTFWNRLTDAWNDRDPTQVLDLVAEHVAFKDPTMATEGRGKTDYREWLGGWFATTDDVQFELKGTARNGTFVAALSRFEGTHAGELRIGGKAIPSTGRRVAMDVAEFFRLDEDGRIERHEVVFDTMTLLSQLGEAAEPQAPAPS